MAVAGKLLRPRGSNSPYASADKQGLRKGALWQAKMLEYRSSYPELAAELLSWIHNDYAKLEYKELIESYTAKNNSYQSRFR